MRQSLVIGNWKMHGSAASADALVSELLIGLAKLESVEVGVCPPYPYLPYVAIKASGTALGLGAQNCADQPEGAYTGEVSVAMLADVGCHYVLLGHSERRSIYAETDEAVVAKTAQVLAQSMCPVVCIGETLEQREAGNTLAVVGEQLGAVLAAFSAQELKTMVVAYEPVWAIGTGLTASPEQAQEVHKALREQLTSSDNSLGALRILYGGSVKAANAEELFGQPDIDGGLIGGAALKAEEFLAICAAAAKQ
ncbi:MAG: triose-phosphate isomerase [Pseudomonadales bacterium]